MEKMLVKDIMNSEPITVEASTSIKEVAQKLIDNDITGMPVVKGNDVIGIITEGDLIMQKAKLHMPMYIQLLDSYLYLEDTKEIEEDLHKIMGLTAEVVMTDEVVTIESSATVEELATMFEEKHLNPIPVVEDESLVGVVSRADIVRLLTKEQG